MSQKVPKVIRSQTLHDSDGKRVKEPTKLMSVPIFRTLIDLMSALLPLMPQRVLRRKRLRASELFESLHVRVKPFTLSSLMIEKL